MKKKKINIPQRKLDLFTGGKPCTPGRIRNISKEEIGDWMNHLEELKKEGKVHTEVTYSLTEHEYYDRLINENIEIENYEECIRLLKLKNETPYSEEKTRYISKIV